MTAKSLASSEDHVRAIAHKLWLEEGMPEGRAEAHWLRALEIAGAESLSALKSTAAPKARAASRATAKKPAAAARKSSPGKRG